MDMYDEIDMKGAKQVSFLGGWFAGAGCVLIIEFFGYMWYTNQVAINQWLMP